MWVYSLINSYNQTCMQCTCKWYYLPHSLAQTTINSYVFLYAATVVLDSSVGTRQACPREMVTYTCTVNQGFILKWIVEPFIYGSDPIQFTSTTDMRIVSCNHFAAVNCTDFNFVATLTNTANMMVMDSTTLADMTSTLTFTATARLNGTVVQCRGSTADATPITNRTLNVIAAGKSCCSI